MAKEEVFHSKTQKDLYNQILQIALCNAKLDGYHVTLKEIQNLPYVIKQQAWAPSKTIVQSHQLNSQITILQVLVLVKMEQTYPSLPYDLIRKNHA